MAGSSFGPLVEPGWPDLKGGPDLAKNFLSGFAQGAAVSYKKQQLENALVAMALKQKESEMNDQLREKQFGLAQQRLGIYADAANARADTAQQRLDFQRETAQDKLDLQTQVFNLANTKYQDRLEGLGGITSVESQLAQEGLTPGSKEYLKRSLELAEPYASKLGSSNFNAWQKKLYETNNAASNQMLQYWKAEKKNFDDDLSRMAFGGKLETDLSKIQNWQTLPDAPDVTTVGWDWRHPLTMPQKAPSKAKTIIGPDNVQHTVAVSTLRDLNSRYQKLQDDLGMIAPQVRRDDLGVNPVTVTGVQNIRPPDSAVHDLRAHPEFRQDFDAKYGQGQADYYLQNP